MAEFKLSEAETKLVEETGAKALIEWDRRLKITDWHEEKKEHGILVFKRKSDEKGIPPMFKSEVIINDTAEFIVSCYDNLPRRKVWDKTMKSVEIIATLHEGLKVMRVVTEPVAGGIISSREFVDALATRKVVDEKEHKYESVSQFIEIKGITQTKGTVRGKNYACGMMIEDLKNDKGEFINQCKITCIYAFDIGGWVPSKAVNAGAVGSMYDMAKHLKKHVETNKEELLKAGK